MWRSEGVPSHGTQAIDCFLTLIKHPLIHNAMCLCMNVWTVLCAMNECMCVCIQEDCIYCNLCRM